MTVSDQIIEDCMANVSMLGKPYTPGSRIAIDFIGDERKTVMYEVTEKLKNQKYYLYEELWYEDLTTCLYEYNRTEFCPRGPQGVDGISSETDI